jgi:hypothetical protein
MSIVVSPLGGALAMIALADPPISPPPPPPTVEHRVTPQAITRTTSFTCGNIVLRYSFRNRRGLFDTFLSASRGGESIDQSSLDRLNVVLRGITAISAVNESCGPRSDLLELRVAACRRTATLFVIWIRNRFQISNLEFDDGRPQGPRPCQW